MHLWQNRAGERFDFSRLDTSLVPERIHAATSLDSDGDGRRDLVLVGKERHLLRNTAPGVNRFVDVTLRDGGREPIGALVRPLYSDGRGAVRRHGSAHNSAFSQALGPLHFGIPAGVSLEGLAVRWPGDVQETRYAVRATGRTVAIER